MIVSNRIDKQSKNKWTQMVFNQESIELQIPTVSSFRNNIPCSAVSISFDRKKYKW